MNQIRITLEQLSKKTLPIGREDENNYTQVIFECGAVFHQHPNAVPALRVKPPRGPVYPVSVVRSGNDVTWTVTDSDLAHNGAGQLQLTFTEGTVICKSVIGRTLVLKSLVSEGPAPDPIQDWLDRAEDALENIEAAEVNPPKIVDNYWYVYDIEQEEYINTNVKAQGADGEPGFSPSASVTKSGKVATITITDGTGTTTATVSDGEADIDDTSTAADKVWSAQKTNSELTEVKGDILSLDNEINGETTYTEETWSGALEKGRYDKQGNYTATSDYRSATVDLTNVVQMKVTATDSAGIGYALIIYWNNQNAVIGSAYDCDGTRKTYVDEIINTFPSGAVKATIVHFRYTYLEPIIKLKKQVVVPGLSDIVDEMQNTVEYLDDKVNGGPGEITERWDGECEHRRYTKIGNYTETNDYRSAIIDMTNVTQMIVSATDAKGTDYAVVMFRNSDGVVIGTALDCNGERRTYTNEVISNIPANTATAIVQNFRLYMDDPIVILKKTEEVQGIHADVEDLKNLTKYKFTMQGKKVVCFGDSIFGNKTPPHDIPSYLEKYLGVTAYNCGFSGAWMADRQSQTGYNAFSLNHLIDSVVDNDFTEQEEAFDITPDLPYTYRRNLTTLEGIDFSTVDIVTIAFGTNDFMSSVPYENQNDAHDVTKVFGSLRHSIEALLTEFPQIRIFVMGQTYRFWMDGQGEFDYDSNTYERGDHTKLTDMVELTKAVAKEYNLPFIDNYKDLGICQYNRTQYFPATDGTHHNDNGVILLARHIAHELF